jgi:hypothetical protein
MLIQIGKTKNVGVIRLSCTTLTVYTQSFVDFSVSLTLSVSGKPSLGQIMGRQFPNRWKPGNQPLTTYVSKGRKCVDADHQSAMRTSENTTNIRQQRSFLQLHCLSFHCLLTMTYRVRLTWPLNASNGTGSSNKDPWTELCGLRVWIQLKCTEKRTISYAQRLTTSVWTTVIFGNKWKYFRKGKAVLIMRVLRDHCKTKWRPCTAYAYIVYSLMATN